MEPRVVASHDGSHLAVLREHRLSLFSLETGRRVAAAEVDGTHVAFVGNHVVVHGSSDRASVLTILTLPTLAVSSSHDLHAATRILATASGHVLLDRGDQAVMIHCGRDAALAPLRPTATFTHAVGLEGPQFVTFGGRGAELWDATSRRPEARMRLTLPAGTVEIGVINRHASLWAATHEACLHVARISDGRVSTFWLDATPRNLRSHPTPAWVVADVGDRVLAINLAIGEVVPLATGGGAIVAVAPRRDRDAGAVVVILDGDALELRLLGGEARPLPRRDDPEGEGPAEPAAAISHVVIGAPASEAGERASSVRERLSRPPERPPAAASVEADVALASGRKAPIAERLGRPMARSLGGVPAAAAAVAVPAVDEQVGVAHAPALAAAPSAPARPSGAGTWRDELLAWSRAGASTVAPTLEASPLRRLHARLALSPEAWVMMCALYGQWLGGGGARGLAMRHLVERVGGDRDGAWPEALGTGGLGAYGLVEWRHGRARLAPAVGDFLDGRPPAEAALVGERARRMPAHGQHEVPAPDDSAWPAAARLAEEHGQVALWRGPVLGAPLAQARLEAWLRGLALVVAGDPGPLTLWPGEAVFAVVSPRPG